MRLKECKIVCQGSTRYGLLAGSGAHRLKPECIYVNNKVSVAHWFFGGKSDVRSSYALEGVVTGEEREERVILLFAMAEKHNNQN